MDKEAYRKTEKMLYVYFEEDIRRITSIRSDIELTKNNIKVIDDKIRTCDFTIDYNQPAITISERVQTSPSGTSYVEREITKRIEGLEKEKAHNIRRLSKLEQKERDLNYKINKLTRNINGLSSESRSFINLKYNPNNQYKRILSVREIAEIMHIGKDTAYTLKDKIVENIALFMSVM